MAKHSIELTAGQRLKVALLQRNFTQREAAATLDITEAHMSSIIRGTESPGLSLAVRIEDAFGIPARDFAQVV